MRWRSALAVLFVVAVALALRVGDLGFRPLHNDEAINAVKLDRLWTTGEYRYDPHEYHGPVLYYLALPVARVAAWWRGVATQGPDEVGMRALTVVAGTLLLLVTVLLVDGLGGRAWVASGLLMAVSPAFVYYSRYFIHELLLVLFTATALGAGWRYTRGPCKGWAALFGASVGMMYATKETFVFNVAAMGMAVAGCVCLNAWRERDSGGVDRRLGSRFVALFRRVHAWDAGVALAAALAVWGLFFTSFLANPGGILDSVRTYWIWVERAGGASPHVHPWWFYWERLLWFRERGGPVWSEAAVVAFAVCGAWMALSKRGETNGETGRQLGRFLLFYTLALAAVYCVIPYKTPWCLLGFHHGTILLAGVGLGGLLARPGWAWRLGIGAAVALAAGHLGWQAWRATREYAADFRNPYVYGHTSADIRNLLDQVREVAAADPLGRRVRVNVMAPESNYWPLPWYLRDFEQIGWWDRIPDDPYAPILVVAARMKAGLEEKSGQAWLMVGMFELRPRYFVELYVEAELWERFLAARRAAREAG